MGIYIGGCGEVAVTEPFLYLFHRYAVREQQRSAAVSKEIQTFGFYSPFEGFTLAGGWDEHHTDFIFTRPRTAPDHDGLP